MSTTTYGPDITTMTRRHSERTHTHPQRATSYLAWLGLALTAASAVVWWVLPAAADWATSWGIWGRFAYMAWATAALASLFETLVRGQAMYALHVTAGVTGYMALTAPGGLLHAGGVFLAVVYIWLITWQGVCRIHPKLRLQNGRKR